MVYLSLTERLQFIFFVLENSAPGPSAGAFCFFSIDVTYVGGMGAAGGFLLPARDERVWRSRSPSLVYSSTSGGKLSLV